MSDYDQKTAKELAEHIAMSVRSALLMAGVVLPGEPEDAFERGFDQMVGYVVEDLAELVALRLEPPVKRLEDELTLISERIAA